MTMDSSALWHAVESGNVRAIERIAAQGVPISGTNGRSRDGLTPLHLAAGIPAARTVRALLLHGADLEARDEHGSTPLQHAVLESPDDRGKAALVLLDAGADVWSTNVTGGTPLHRVNNLMGAPRRLVARMNASAEVVIRGWDRSAPSNLSNAAIHGDASDVEAAADSGADGRDPAGFTALYHVVRRTLPPRPSRRNDHPLTAEQGVRAVRALRAAGASPLTPGPNGTTPRALAEESFAPDAVIRELDA
jgi:hypothetical protein